MAALWDNAELLEDLLNNGDELKCLDARDSWGRSALHAAATNANSRYVNSDNMQSVTDTHIVHAYHDYIPFLDAYGYYFRPVPRPMPRAESAAMAARPFTWPPSTATPITWPSSSNTGPVSSSRTTWV